MFLTAAELRTLTGYVSPTKQREWLKRAGVSFFVSGSGRPVVLREALVSAQSAVPMGRKRTRDFDLRRGRNED